MYGSPYINLFQPLECRLEKPEIICSAMLINSFSFFACPEFAEGLASLGTFTKKRVVLRALSILPFFLKFPITTKPAIKTMPKAIISDNGKINSLMFLRFNLGSGKRLNLYHIFFNFPRSIKVL